MSTPGCERWVRTWVPARRCTDDAVFDVVDPDGVVRLRYCQKHGRDLCLEYEEKLGELWTLRTLEPLADA